MIAYHGNPHVKAEYLARVNAHREHDELVKGKYWEDGKGCAVGCTVHSSDHSAYETELGIPDILARLEDRIFEGLPNELAMTWPSRFLDVIAVGADLSRVWHHFAIFLMTDSSQCASRHPQCDIVADLCRAEIRGEMVDWQKSAKDAANAADAAADAKYAAAHAAANAKYAAAHAAAHAADAADAKYAAADAKYAAAKDAANAADAAADAAVNAAADAANAADAVVHAVVHAAAAHAAAHAAYAADAKYAAADAKYAAAKDAANAADAAADAAVNAAADAANAADAVVHAVVHAAAARAAVNAAARAAAYAAYTAQANKLLELLANAPLGT